MRFCKECNGDSVITVSTGRIRYHISGDCYPEDYEEACPACNGNGYIDDWEDDELEPDPEELAMYRGGYGRED